MADRRTFFTEGESYDPPSYLFYSRRIPQFDVGMKVFGRRPGLSLSVLDAVNFGERNDLALSCEYALDPLQRVSASYVGADWKGMHNRAFAADYSNHHLERNGRVGWGAEVTGSATAGPGGEGMVQWYHVGFSPAAGYLGWSVSYEDHPREYYAADGRQEENGLRGWEGAVYKEQYYEGSWLRAWEWEAEASYYRAEGGGLHHSDLSAYGGASTRYGGSVSVGYSQSRRPPNVDRIWSLGVGWGENTPLQAGRASASLGKLLGADYLYASLAQCFQPLENLGFSVSGEYQRFHFAGEAAEDEFQGILGASYDISPERSVAGRCVTRAGANNFYVSYRQVVRKGLDAYLIIGNPNVEQTEGRVAAKVVYCF